MYSEGQRFTGQRAAHAHDRSIVTGRLENTLYTFYRQTIIQNILPDKVLGEFKGFSGQVPMKLSKRLGLFLRTVLKV